MKTALFSLKKEKSANLTFGTHAEGKRRETSLASRHSPQWVAPVSSDYPK
ncbi:MAG TPA: hypothetical protein PK299_08790 [Anaerolineales bacterium]|nr:hypothetical protein [Anaerolineales bacterium]